MRPTDPQIPPKTFSIWPVTLKQMRLDLMRRKGVNTAVSRVANRVLAQNCNCLEITQIATKSFLGIRI